MPEGSNKQLAKLDNNQILSLIESMPNLDEGDKQQLQLQIMSDNLELRKTAMDKLLKSQQAQADISDVMNQILEAPKQGVYINAKQTAETGSGKVEIEVKGGDTKFIVPVLTILAIVALVVLFIVFG